jgi:exodeoxyribonuclease VII large subunit
VALVPDRQAIQQRLAQERSLVKQVVILRLERERQRLSSLRERLDLQHPTLVLQRLRHDLQHRLALLQALSPEHLLQRGFALVRTATGELVRSAQQVTPGDALSIQLAEGQLEVEVKQHHPQQAG